MIIIKQINNYNKLSIFGRNKKLVKKKGVWSQKRGASNDRKFQ